MSYGMRCIPGCEEYPRCEKYPMRYGVFWNMRIIPWDKDYSMVGGLFHSMSILGKRSISRYGYTNVCLVIHLLKPSRFFQFKARKNTACVCVCVCVCVLKIKTSEEYGVCVY